jgi:large subunit ribosomal protein L2
MGKNLISQRRGRGSMRYRKPVHNYIGAVKHIPFQKSAQIGRVIDIVHCASHTAPLAKVVFEDGSECLQIAPEKMVVNQTVAANTTEVGNGNTLYLQDIADGTAIYNIEGVPGDGGKYVRSSGVFARVMVHQENNVVVLLPSKKQKTFNAKCRATIGVVAGGGRLDKPFLTAGHKFFKMKATNKLWPRVSGAKMNAVDHPFGNKRSSRKSKARVAPKNAPPGRKAGMVRARRTGRKKL